MSNKMTIDQALLQVIRESGDAAAVAGVCHTYTLLIPTDIWDEVFDGLDLDDNTLNYFHQHFRVKYVTVNEYTYQKVEIRHWTKRSWSDLITVLTDRHLSFIPYPNSADYIDEVSDSESIAHTSLE